MSVAEKYPKISVIVTNYNYGCLINDAIKSLQAQSHENFECFIIDDGSTDNSAEVIKDLISNDKRFKLIEQENQGLSEARNTGIKKASGDFFMFLDADDFLNPENLHSHIQKSSGKREITIVKSVFFKENGNFQPIKTLEQNLSADDFLRQLIRKNLFTVSAPMIPAELIRETGFFDSKLTALEDWDYWLRMALKGVSISYVDSRNSETMIRVTAGSMSSNREKMRENEIAVRKKIMEKLPKELEVINREILEHRNLFHVYLAYVKGDLKKRPDLKDNLKHALKNNQVVKDYFQKLRKRKLLSTVFPKYKQKTEAMLR